MEDQRREKDNPFQPISLDERLSRPVPKTRHTAHEPMMMRPGQLYGRTPFYQPAVMGSPAPTEPASPQTIPFSSFQPFGSVNASVAPMQPEPLLLRAFGLWRKFSPQRRPSLPFNPSGKARWKDRPPKKQLRKVPRRNIFPNPSALWKRMRWVYPSICSAARRWEKPSPVIGFLLFPRRPKQRPPQQNGRLWTCRCGP